jgi:hypothetical protein
MKTVSTTVLSPQKSFHVASQPRHWKDNNNHFPAFYQVFGYVFIHTVTSHG